MEKSSAELNKRQRKEEKWSGKTDEEILDIQQKGWKSNVYQHYKDPVIIHRDGKVLYKFVCAKNPSIAIHRDRFDDSTSNLKAHAKNCDPEKKGNIAEYAAGSTYSAAKGRFLLASWCANRARPYAIVHDPEFVEWSKMLYSKVDIVSQQTVSRDIVEMHAIAREDVIEKLANFVGKVHIGIDGWVSANVLPFLGITIALCNKGEMEQFLLEFVRVYGRHTGQLLAKELAQVLRDFRIDKKVLGLVCDNASNNDTLTDALAKEIPSFRVTGRIRCLGHIFNLCVKAILRPFSRGLKKRKAGEEAEDDAEWLDLLTKDLDEEDDDGELELDEEAEDADEDYLDGLDRNDDDEVDMASSKPDCSPEELKDAAFALFKLSNLAKKVHWNPSLRQAFLEGCKTHKLEKQLVLVRAVANRWNTQAAMIGRAIDVKPVVNDVCDMTKFNSNGMRLRSYSFSDKEWEILEQLYPILDLFVGCTKKMEQESVPLIYQVIPEIDKLTNALSAARDDESIHPAVRVGAWLGIRHLNKYYALSDDSIVYRLAMVLHPSFKLKYFREHKWQASWITQVQELLNEEWKLYCPAELETASSQPNPKKNPYAHFMCDDEDSSTVDFVNEYLYSPVVKNVKNPLAYWRSILESGSSDVQSRFAQMAIDFLSAPATSTTGERGFSGSGRMVSKFRHKLGDRSIRAATVYRSWHDHGLIPKEKILDSIRAKGSRWTVEEAVQSTVISID